MSSFTWRGKEYEYVEKPMLSEMIYAERKFGRDGGEFTRSELTVATWFMSIKRVDPGTTWEAVLSSTQDEFEDVPDPEQVTPPAEIPEHQWPLDPTAAGTRTAPPSESGQHALEPSPMTETAT